MRLWIIAFMAGVIFLSACAPEQEMGTRQPQEVEKEAVPMMDEEEIKTLPDGTKYLIHPNEFLSGGPGKGGIGFPGGIPSLVDPDFVSAEEADYLPDEELVLGLVWKGEARAYPFRILVWHEIANDVIQGDPLLVTWCPLCFTGVAFIGEVEGKRELFGVSGKLINSELVMYDKTTESYWPQSLGKAVVGPRTGMKLKKIPIDVARWGDWKRAHPDTKVMSEKTGFLRNYGRNPYGRAGDFSDIGFRIGVSVVDPRLPAQIIVHGIELDGSFKAYRDIDVRENKVINDVVGGKAVVVLLHPDIGGPRVFVREVNGQMLTFELIEEEFVDKETKTIWDADGMAVEGQLEGTQLEQIVHEPAFWFAWAAFHPDTELYGNS